MAVDEALALAKSDKRKLPEPDSKKYSGKFVVRTDPSIHGMVAIKAKLSGQSLNAFVNKLLTKA